MQFIRVGGIENAGLALGERLISELKAGRRVLWLTSGGSNVPVQVDILRSIPEDLTRNLTIMPNDERCGPVGHADSNWQEMLDAGFDSKQARLLPVLEEGLDFEETASRFEKTAREEFRKHDIIISQLGMGADGHVSGILPNTAAAAEDKLWVKAYEHAPLKRITLTFPALREVNSIFLFAFGEAKRSPLESLRDSNLPLNEQPAQILKEVAEAYVYSDQIGDPA